MLTESLKNYNLILGSTSPRRKFLLEELGLKFTIEKPIVDEVYPDSLPVEDIAVYLAGMKAEAVRKKIGNQSKNIIITADTIVLLHNKVIGKPENEADAVRILSELSGNKHLVISGVCLCTQGSSFTFSEKTEVFFRTLTQDEILHYIAIYKPLDKAGAYGIQEWIGMTGVTRINGCFFNVMGLPVPRLYKELMLFAERLSA